MFGITPQPLYPEEKTRYPLNRWLGGPESRAQPFEEERNIFPVPEFELRNLHYAKNIIPAPQVTFVLQNLIWEMSGNC